MTSLDGRVRAGSEGPDDAPAVEDPDSPRPGEGGAEVVGADAATVRRARPRRATTAPSSSSSSSSSGPVPPGDGDPGPASGPVPPPAPPRRPVPPTFPSPGQPPPGVARRAGRHARPEVAHEPHTPPEGYRPRHAAPDAETEQFAAVPATGPGSAGPMAPAALAVAGDPAGALASVEHSPHSDLESDLESTGGERVRVVLAERRVPTRAVRTVAEIEQQTETGELLLGNLLRAQLTLGLRLGGVAVLLLGALPVLFLVFPGLGEVSLLGVRVPWLLLGVLPYPVMLLLASFYTRTAERNELDFADNVED